MKRILKVAWAAVLVLFAASAFAQPMPEQRPGQGQPFSQAELDQMLAPIALYPDPLLSHILAAATFPRDVAEASAWLRTHQDLRGQAAVEAARHERWDPSVVSLTAFPDVLAMMEERRYWTEKLGEAFVEQPSHVMDTVQQLRARADASGHLRSGEEILVERRGPDYVIEPAQPEVVYVPYYDPRVVYGSWWWPDYPPVYWNPWPGYSYYGYSGFGWGYGVTLGSSFWFGAFDWPRRYLRYAHHRPWYYSGRDWRRGDRWHFDRHRYWAGRERWRDGDRRWDGTRDGRTWQGRTDGRTWQGRDGRAYQGRQTAADGQVLRSPTTRQAAPALSGDGVQRTRRREEPRYEGAAALQRAPQVEGAPVMRQRVAPVQQGAPAMQQSAPVQRSAPAPAQVQRAAPAVERPAAPNPAARASEPARQAPERSREERSNPAERGNRAYR